jgi:hypothetical protein
MIEVSHRGKPTEDDLVDEHQGLIENKVLVGFVSQRACSRLGPVDSRPFDQSILFRVPPRTKTASLLRNKIN